MARRLQEDECARKPGAIVFPKESVIMGGVSLEQVYTYHPPHGTQQERYVILRNKAKELAQSIEQNTPQSREQSVALTNVQQAVMWANAAIAINEGV